MDRQRDLLQQRYEKLMVVCKSLILGLWPLLNLLPVTALRSATDLFDCMASILDAHIGPYNGMYKHFKNVIIAMRTGLFYPNLVGRSYFKYVIEHSLQVFRQLVLDEPVVVPFRRLGFSDNMLHIAPEELAPIMQHIRTAAELNDRSN